MPADGVGDRAEITFRYSPGETRSLGRLQGVHVISAVGMEREYLILVKSTGYLFSRNVTRARISILQF